MKIVTRYYYTLRYLKPSQFWGRIFFKLRKPKPNLSPEPSLRKVPGKWVPPVAKQVSLIAPRRFRFLNQEFEIHSKDQWNSSQIPKLWLYNLHYFDDLNAIDASARSAWHKSLVTDWVCDNSPVAGNGWEPYPLSLRIVNWIKWSMAGNELTTVSLHSLSIQIRHLLKRLEYHLLGNHLFANAKALVFAGCFFYGDEADAWLQQGMDILKEQVPEQILPDGGHFERSTMYHTIVLEDILDLLNLTRTFPSAFEDYSDVVADWLRRIGSMVGWLCAMCHRDREISFFNDSALGITPKISNIIDYSSRLGVVDKREFEQNTIWMKESGYVRAMKGDGLLIADVAPVGPDYLPGHAHADTLSFEFSYGTQRVIVNSGTSTYEVGTKREWERSTAAHNTVVIDDHNSSEVWDSFRVARRAYPFNIKVIEKGDSVVIEASHDGYVRLPGRNIHHRRWTLSDGSLLIEDKITGEFEHGCARYYFHPSVVVIADEGYDCGLLQIEGRTFAKWEVKNGFCCIEKTVYCPEFGRCLNNVCVEANFVAPDISMLITWQC